MKKKFATILLVTGVLFYASCQTNNQGSAELESNIDSVSYALGVDVAQNMKASGLDSVNHAAFAQGVQDVLEGAEEDLKIHPSMANQIVSAYITSLRTRTLERNQKESEDFLAENKEQEGVSTTESGLQYLVLEEGSGVSPDENDRVTVHYVGKTIAGKIFDSSVERGEPATFGVNQVIPGWTEGLQLMKEGAKWRFFIPSDLAYGARGAGPDIGPNAALIFDVELISVEQVD